MLEKYQAPKESFALEFINWPIELSDTKSRLDCPDRLFRLLGLLVIYAAYQEALYDIECDRLIKLFK